MIYTILIVCEPFLWCYLDLTRGYELDGGDCLFLLVQVGFDGLRIGARDQVHPGDQTVFVTLSKG